MSRPVSKLAARTLTAALLALALPGIFGPPVWAGVLAGYCASFKGNRIFNSCNSKIWVMWYDDGYCTSATGCGDWVGANGEEAIMATKGRVRSAACFWPETPHRVGSALAWSGEESYECKK